MNDQATISRDQVVSLDYVLSDEHGTELDSSKHGSPLTYLHGHENIIPSLENALEGKKVGDRVSLTAPPDQAFGEHDPERVFEVPHERFDFDIEPGQVVRMQTPAGVSPPLQVVSVTEDKVTLDANHPLAGKTLKFDVTVLSIRQATDDERSHGHHHD